MSHVGVGIDESPTLHTSVAVPGTNHDNTGVDNLNDPIVSENGGEYPEHLKISEELESQLAATVKRTVEQALFIFKEQVQKRGSVVKKHNCCSY